MQSLPTSGNYIYSIPPTNLDTLDIVIPIIIISLELIALGVRDLENNTLKMDQEQYQEILNFHADQTIPERIDGNR